MKGMGSAHYKITGAASVLVHYHDLDRDTSALIDLDDSICSATVVASLLSWLPCLSRVHLNSSMHSGSLDSVRPLSDSALAGAP